MMQQRLFERPNGESYSFDRGYDDTSYSGHWDTFTKLTAVQPSEMRATLRLLVSAVRGLPTEDLIILKTTEGDVCGDKELIDCRGVRPQVVKQYVEVALNERAKREANAIASRQMIVTMFSATGTVLSFIVAVVALAKRGH